VFPVWDYNVTKSVASGCLTLLKEHSNLNGGVAKHIIQKTRGNFNLLPIFAALQLQ
jgi:hypothetical protein